MDSNLNILVSATDQASGVLQGVSGQLTAMGGAATSASQSLTDSMSATRSAAVQVGAIAGGVFAGLSMEIKSATETNADWNLTWTDINNTLKNTGSSLPISELEAFAKTMSDSTLFNQQQVASSIQLVVGNKELQGSFSDVLGVASDLATHMKTDLPSATQALMKVLNDPATAVQRLANTYNIDLTPAQVKTITAMGKVNDIAGAQAELMKAIESQIGGAAKAANNASGTGFDKLQDSMQVLQNTIGNALNPVLDKMLAKLVPVIDKIAGWINDHPKLTAAILLSAAAIAGIIAACAALVAGIISVGLAIVAVAGSGTVGLFIAAFAAVAAGIIFLITQFNNMKATIVGIWDDIKPAWQAAVGWIENLIDGLLSKIQALGSAIANSAVGKAFSAVGNVVSSVGSGVMNAVHAIGLATGGIVTQPTFALIGEAGPEAVVPLSGLGAGSTGGGAININIGSLYGTDQNAARNFANLIAKQLNQQIKLRTY